VYHQVAQPQSTGLYVTASKALKNLVLTRHAARKTRWLQTPPMLHTAGSFTIRSPNALETFTAVLALLPYHRLVLTNPKKSSTWRHRAVYFTFETMGLVWNGFPANTDARKQSMTFRSTDQAAILGLAAAI